MNNSKKMEVLANLDDYDFENFNVTNEIDDIKITYDEKSNEISLPTGPRRC